MAEACRHAQLVTSMVPTPAAPAEMVAGLLDRHRRPGRSSCTASCLPDVIYIIGVTPCAAIGFVTK